jgi:hypothetical protein
MDHIFRSGNHSGIRVLALGDLKQVLLAKFIFWASSNGSCAGGVKDGATQIFGAAFGNSRMFCGKITRLIDSWINPAKSD